MYLLFYLIVAYLGLSLQASIFSLIDAPGPFTVSLAPVFILLAFHWFSPLTAGILSTLIALEIEKTYAAPPGTALMLTTFLALLFTQPSIKRLLQTPIVFVIACLPLVFLYDYTLLLISDLLAPTSTPPSEIAPQFIFPSILPSLFTALRTTALVSVISTLLLGLRALFSPKPTPAN